MVNASEKFAEDASPLNQLNYFATPIYITHQPKFLDVVKKVAADSISYANGKNKPDKIYPVMMSGNMLNDDRITEFADFVGSTAWNILASQGFAMDQFMTSFTEMWCQEHYQTSSMEYHSHSGGNHIVGFYFLDTPENCPKAIFHDPRPARTMVDLPQSDTSQATLASTAINFTPEPGMMLFAPAWLPHSFGRNPSKHPFRFVHFNLTVLPNTQTVCYANAEII